MPDNGLANLAACLLARGHNTLIWDLSTVDTVRRLFPHIYKDRLQELIKKIIGASKQGLKPDGEDLKSYYDIENKIDELQKSEIINIACEISVYVKEHKIDFVGFKLWTGSGFEGAMIIAEQLKRDNPDLKIFGGGPHIDWFHGMVFNVTDVFDALAYGEGEETIVMLAEYAEGKIKLEEIPNLLFKKDDKIVTTPLKRIEDLNKLPLPVYDDDIYPAMKNGQKIKAIMLDESRGCPNACSFCIHGTKSGRKWRTVEAKVLVDKIEKIMKKYKIRAFRFAGSNPSPKLMEEIAKEIIRRKLDISYTAFAYSHGMTKECCELLKKSGCCVLFFGVESGNQRVLHESMNKKVKTDRIKESIRFCKESGMKAIASFIVPAPYETEESKKDTLDFLLETRPDSTLVFFPALIPGTDWERNCVKYGFHIDNYNELFEKAMSFRVSHLSPPVLWRPLDGFSMNGKSFKEICSETFSFIQRVKQNGLTTQLFDHTFLISHTVKMDNIEFTNRTNDCFTSGDYLNLEKIVYDINRNILIS